MTSQAEDRRPLRLVLAEDDSTQRMIMTRLLQDAGYVVDAVRTGDEALAKIVGGGYQILITDWDMPGMDGATLCRRVRGTQLESYLYVLLLTAYNSIESTVAGLEAGADDYIRKPANAAELIARLNSGRRIIRLEQSLLEAAEQIRLLSITDPLVGIFNRRYLNEQLVRDIERARRYHHHLAVIISDIDHFKSINDRLGHQAGDEVLQAFVVRLQESIRSSDWVARYGGEEFVIVLPETGLTEATLVAEKVRVRCAAEPFLTMGGALTVTASFGVASLEQSAIAAVEAAEALLHCADVALFGSKDAGRNLVMTAG
jgi:diguanylate cyclase (GGDEF)-like protein